MSEIYNIKDTEDTKSPFFYHNEISHAAHFRFFIILTHIYVCLKLKGKQSNISFKDILKSLCILPLIKSFNRPCIMTIFLNYSENVDTIFFIISFPLRCISFLVTTIFNVIFSPIVLVIVTLKTLINMLMVKKEQQQSLQLKISSSFLWCFPLLLMKLSNWVLRLIHFALESILFVLEVFVGAIGLILSFGKNYYSFLLWGNQPITISSDTNGYCVHQKIRALFALISIAAGTSIFACIIDSFSASLFMLCIPALPLGFALFIIILSVFAFIPITSYCTYRLLAAIFDTVTGLFKGKEDQLLKNAWHTIWYSFRDNEKTQPDQYLSVISNHLNTQPLMPQNNLQPELASLSEETLSVPSFLLNEIRQPLTIEKVLKIT